jgi:GT2 family glycosyltransferase
MSEPTVAIICITHGRPELVKKCLQSCARQDYQRLEILVVVNPVDALSEAAVVDAAPNARILRTHRNVGFFPALNLACANTEADYLMIVDDDAQFIDDDAVTRLVAEFGREPRLGAVTCNLEGPHERPISGGDEYIRVFTTGFTMLPRRVLTDWVGYLPDMFFRSAGETFLCTALWDQRRPIKRLEGVRMFHALAQEGRSLRQWRFYSIRSQILCAVMREPATWLIPMLASQFIKGFLLAANKGDLHIWLHAWLSSFFYLREAQRFRKPISRSTRRLLIRLDSTRVTDLSTCSEWLAGNLESRKPGQAAAY